jgi:hypothetical protein
VRAGQSEAELVSVRGSLRSGRPFGTFEWTEQMAKRLNIELVPRPRGRPPKKKELTLFSILLVSPGRWVSEGPKNSDSRTKKMLVKGCSQAIQHRS